MQLGFTLISKPPNQGRGLAGKNAKRFEIKTNFGAILHDVVKSAYEKHQGKEPERRFFLKKEHVTSARSGEVLANRERLRCEMRRAQQRIPGVHYDL